MGTFLVGLVVLLAAANAVRCIWRDKKAGKSCSSCGCFVSFCAYSAVHALRHNINIIVVRMLIIMQKYGFLHKKAKNWREGSGKLRIEAGKLRIKS